MPPKKSFCQICKKTSRSFELTSLSDLSMKTSNGENLTLLKAMQQLTGIDINTDNHESEFLCQQCVYQIKFACNIRNKIIETMTNERHYTFEIYKIISNDSEELNIVSADDTIQLNEEQEGILLEHVIEEQDAIVEEIDESEDSQSADDNIYISSDNKIDTDGAEDGVSFLLNKKELFQKKKKPTEDRPHVCQVCQKAFGRKSNLIDHLRLHANVRPYKCEYCGKTFVQPGNYRSHLRIHTKERPYECSICKKTYNQPNALKVHIRTHTNERNFICSECNKAFTNSSDLSKHRRVHDPSLKMKCDMCEKTFAQKINLKTHIIRHHTTKPSKGTKK